ncbi:hypothetical protein [Streptomyces misionensis]|uniref:hypothetical protein n=1 Tax=Streptomyces misionensis TaxID=67331 RepID=UPI0036CA2632
MEPNGRTGDHMQGSGTESGGGPQRKSTSRRGLLGLAAGAALATAGLAARSADGGRDAVTVADAGGSFGAVPAGAVVSQVTAPPASGVLGANYNESLDMIDYAELGAVSATWMRGFYLMSDADSGDPATQTGMATLLQASSDGYGTVLSTKFQYHDTTLPAPGTAAMNTALTRLDKVLAAVLGKVDIVTIGNEPFYETSQADRTTSAINDFYEALARHAIRYRSTYFGLPALQHVVRPPLDLHHELDGAHAQHRQARRVQLRHHPGRADSRLRCEQYPLGTQQHLLPLRLPDRDGRPARPRPHLGLLLPSRAVGPPGGFPVLGLTPDREGHLRAT